MPTHSSIRQVSRRSVVKTSCDGGVQAAQSQRSVRSEGKAWKHALKQIWLRKRKPAEITVPDIVPQGCPQVLKDVGRETFQCTQKALEHRLKVTDKICSAYNVKPNTWIKKIVMRKLVLKMLGFTDKLRKKNLSIRSPKQKMSRRRRL